MAYLFLIALILPEGLRAYHAISDHVEIHCQEDIPNHFHRAEFDCDFHKYVISPALFTPGEQTKEVTEIHGPQSITPYLLPSYSENPGYYLLRGPPV